MQLLQQFAKELRKVHEQHQLDLDKRARSNEEAERKLRKKILAGQDATMKTFVAHQKREYKAAKDRVRQEVAKSALSKRAGDAHVQQRKQQLHAEQADSERRLAHDQQRQLELELRKLRRTRIIQYHLLEQELLREVGRHVTGA
jgi:thousand and one amino acid protein kinase